MINRTPNPVFLARTTPWPRIFSADFQVRLKAGQTNSLHWRHLDTSLHTDASMHRIHGLPIEGLTEWTALHEGRRLTLGWDWLLCNDGQCVAGTEIPPRANIQMLDLSGYDLGHEASAEALWGIISQIRWQAEVSDWLEQQRAVTPLF